MMYKMVVHAVLLHGREIWVVTDAIMTVLEIFHQRIDRQVARMILTKGNRR